MAQETTVEQRLQCCEELDPLELPRAAGFAEVSRALLIGTRSCGQSSWTVLGSFPLAAHEFLPFGSLSLGPIKTPTAGN